MDAKEAKIQKRGGHYIQQHRTNPHEVDWISLDEFITDPDNRNGEEVKIDDVVSKAEMVEAQGFDMTKVRIVLVSMPLDAGIYKHLRLSMVMTR